MPHFMGIPTEVRLSIFEYCLIIGKIFPYLESQLEKEKAQSNPARPSLPTIKEKREQSTLCVGLLQINKTVYAEAAPILYGKNTVILPDGPLAAKFFNNCLNSAAKRLWLKNVELELCALDMSLDEQNEWNDENCTRDLHDTWKDHLAKVIWPQKLAPILEDTKLDKLTVEFRNSKCQAGCCYMDVEACAAFQRGFAKGMVTHISLHHISFHGPGHWQDPDPESFKKGDREISGMELPIVSDADGEEDVDRDAIQVGEQIARWTRARELRVENGTRMWFQAAEQGEEEEEEEEDEEIGSDDDEAS